MSTDGSLRLIGLVADDLTGAGDSAVAFAELGWRVLLHLDPSRPPTTARGAAASVPTVLAVSTGTRARTDAEAAATTARVVDGLRQAGVDRIYLKVDSTIRGSVAGQVAGALDAWDDPALPARAVICPAFPEHHRTVVAGHVHVDGVPLDQTTAAHDPVTPRTTSDLTAILPGSVCGDVTQIGRVQRLVVDAATDADLDKIAGALTAAGSARFVVVGSGGLAAALARRWSGRNRRAAWTGALGDAPVLVAASSLHPVTAAQLQHLRHSPASGRVDVLTTHDLGTTTPDCAASSLADRVAAAVADRDYGAVVAVGGDGAAAILSRLTADQVIIDGAVLGGCPTGVISGGGADGLRLVTKSGGFGDPATLATLVARLRSGPSADHRSDTPTASGRPIQKDSS